MRSEQLISRKTLIMSVAFHLLVALSFSVAWPFIASPPTTAQPLVIVNMVERVPETNLEAAKSKSPKASEIEQEETKKRPPPPPPPPPPPKPVEVAKAPEAPAKAPAPNAEILPDKQVKPPKPKPVSAPAARPTPPKIQQPPKQPRTVSVDAPPSRPNKLIKKSQQKQKSQALSGVLQNLADVSKSKKAEQNQKAKQKQEARDSLANTLAQAAAENTPNEQEQKQLKLGQSDFDRLRAHISQCWAPPLGAKGAGNLKVDILLELERDGTVKRAEILDSARFNNDKTYKVAAEAALRAVIGCGKLPLPAEKFELWKKFIFGFDPKFM